MVSVVTINCPDMVARIEILAKRLTGGNKTEVIALALRNLEERDARSGSLFGANRGSVAVREGVDLTAPVLDDFIDAEVGLSP